MLSLAFVGVAEDLVFYGPTGRGKTHMATAIGIAAASAGYPVRFFQTSQLVLQLLMFTKNWSSGAAVAILDQGKVTRRTACTARSSACGPPCNLFLVQDHHLSPIR